MGKRYTQRMVFLQLKRTDYELLWHKTRCISYLPRDTWVTIKDPCNDNPVRFTESDAQAFVNTLSVKNGKYVSYQLVSAT